jgi:putative hydrolase of the HAD superfamily
VRISPSTVIFDYGNVLSQPQPVSDIEAMAQILDLPVARFLEVYWEFRVPYDAGTLTPAEYWGTLADTASRSLAGGQIDTLIDIDGRSWSHPAPLVPEWAGRLREAGLRTALLSNMPGSVRDYVMQCAWLPEFDARVFSCDSGVCKPAAQIYQDCLRRLEAEPGEVLFFDDREANVRAAEALGLHAIVFTNAADAACEVERRFSLPVTLK